MDLYTTRRIAREVDLPEEVIEQMDTVYCTRIVSSIVRNVVRVLFWMIMFLGVLPEILHFAYRMTLLFVAAWFGVEFLETALELIQLW